MNIEEAIKQKEFKSDAHRAYINLIYTSNFLAYKQSKYLKTYKLTVQQYNILRILRGQFPNAATINTLMERMLDKNSNASRIVERLKMKGLVSRVQCEEDRRVVHVKITNIGLSLLKRIDKEMIMSKNPFEQLNNKEINQLNELLNKIRS